jgi:[ribosomal protein S18]-alanine N-acetyltransferase
VSVLARLLPGHVGHARVSIEPMRRRHLRDVMPIEASAYPKPWSRSVFDSELDQVRGRSRYYVVARAGRAVVGYAGLWFVNDPDGDQAHVTNVVVDREHRRTGIATALMCHLASVAIERGCVAWTLEVRVTSTGAQELYRRFGFGPAGVRKRYYENSEDAIVMWCHDLRTPEYAQRLEELRCT